MKTIKLFCFGIGQVAKSFISNLRKKNFNLDLTVTSREISKNDTIIDLDCKKFKFDMDNYDANLLENLKNAEYVLVSIPPVNKKDIVIENFEKYFTSKLKWITYLSATSVYGDHKGAWVDENSKTNPTSENGINRLNAEKLWIEKFKKNKLPIQIFRLSGIYSHENNILKRILSGSAKIIDKKDHFFSRVHVDDISNILLSTLTNFVPGEIYNISDDRPASADELVSYGSKLLGLDLPKKIKENEIESKMLKDFYKDSKKLNNKKIKNFLNYSFKYPSYIEGLNEIRKHII